jgi:hypothetical protein
MWTDRITIQVSATNGDSNICQFNQWTILTNEEVMVPPGAEEDRLPWEFYPNFEEESLEFRKLDDLYKVNLQQALDVEFMEIMGSPTSGEDYSQNAVSKVENVCKGPKEEEETFMLAYKFEKPILLRGYMIKTANDCPE